ncbi:MAG TPA: IclR family transcriptional regulator [Conexibacter sp.]|nr:IclR family transcriptional regulator [Conexibacter sp.]
MVKRGSADEGLPEGAAGDEGGSSRYSVRAVERVADILDTLQQSESGASLVRLAEVTGLPKSSVFRYVATLEARGYVERDPLTGDFVLGVALPSHRRHFDLLIARARPLLERLRDRFGETVNFAVLDDDRVRYLEIVESPKAMRLAARRGERDFVHSTAVGRAIAANLPEREVRRIVSSAGMPALTPRTITSIEELLARLEEVRADGYAIDDEENEEGARCVAVALPGARMPAGISVSAPAVRLSREEARRVAAELVDDVSFLGRRIGGPPAASAAADPQA